MYQAMLEANQKTTLAEQPQVFFMLPPLKENQTVNDWQSLRRTTLNGG
jgi:hypothetical protein